MKDFRTYENSENIAEEYETQYFSFGRNVLKTSLSSLVESKLQDHIESAKKYFVSSVDSDEELKKKVADKCANLLKFTLNKSQILMNEAFMDLDKYFHIPETVQLPQDELFSKTVNDCEVDLLRKEAIELKLDILSLDAAQIIMEKELFESGVVRNHLTVKEQQLLSYLDGLNVLFEDKW